MEHSIIESIAKSKEQAINHAHKVHGELSWRQKVYNFEIKDTYTVKDLIILNSFITPYEQKKDMVSLDNHINSVITDILFEVTKSQEKVKGIDRTSSRYNAICDVLTKVDQKELAEIETTPTLFDFPINNGLLKKSLNPEQSAKVRECAHLLLKNDWKKQTFVKAEPDAMKFAFIYNIFTFIFGILSLICAVFHINHIFSNVFKFIAILGIVVNAFCVIQSLKFNNFKNITIRILSGLFGILANIVLISTTKHPNLISEIALIIFILLSLIIFVIYLIERINR